MALAIFFYPDADQNHEHDESDDAFFFGREDKEFHSRLGLISVMTP
jgi:hypothetical protein